MTLAQLIRSTMTLANGPARFRTNPISDRRTLIKYVPYLVTKSVLFQFNVFALSDRAEYSVNLFFNGLDIRKDPFPNSFYMKYKGEMFYANIFDISKANVTVRCSCRDFRFVWSWYNREQKALFGPNPLPYTRKTSTRPSPNPRHIPGLCKHTFHCARDLQDMGLLKGMGRRP